MNNESNRVLKHDLMSGIGSIFSAVKLIEGNENNPEETKAILKLISAKEEEVMKNITSLIEKSLE